MRRHVTIWASALGIVAAMLTIVAPPASAAVAACPTLPSVPSVGTVTGTVSGPTSEERAAVYVIDTETGGMTCAVTSADGTYSVALPGVRVEDGDPRKPSDAWFIVANPSPTSALASSSQILVSDVVTAGSTVSSRNFTLQTADLTVMTYAVGSSTPVQAPTTACLVNPDSVIPTTCGVTQERNGTWSARLAVPASGAYLVDAYLMQSGAWLEGSSAGDPLTKGDGVTSVEVILEPEGLLTCPAGTITVSGTVTRVGAQGAVPTRAYVEAIAAPSPTDYDRYWIGTTTSQRDGSYALCVSPDELPPGMSLDDVDVTLRAERLTGGITIVEPWDGQDASVDLTIPGVAPVGGTISYQGAGAAGSVNWTVAPLVTQGGQTFPGPDVAYGRADFMGSWGVAGLAAGDYILRSYPNARGFAMASAEFTVTGSGLLTVNATLPSGNLNGRILLPDGTPNAYAWVGATDPSTCGTNGCDEFGASTDAEGYFSMLLGDGTYVLRANPGWNQSGVVVTQARVSVTGETVTCLEGCSISNGLIILTLGEPNASFRIMSEQSGAPDVTAPGAYLSLQQWVPQQDPEAWPWQDATGGMADTGGIVETSLESGVYRLYVFPPQGVLAPPSVTYVEASVAGDQVSLVRCETPLDSQSNPCEGSTEPFAQTSGAWQLVLPLPNLTATLESPQGVAVAAAGYQIQRIVAEGNGTRTYWVDSGTANESGEIAVLLDAPGVYQVSLRLPNGVQEDWVGTTYSFTRTEAGVCLMSGPDVPCESEPNGPWTGDLAFGVPNVSGIVIGAGGDPLGDTWMEISQPCDWYDGCRQPFEGNPGTFINSTGLFQLNLPEDDTYILTVHPWRSADGSVRTSFTVPIAAGQALTGDDSLTLQLRGANVTGRITTADDTPAVGSWVNVERYRDFGGYGNWEGTDVGGSVNAAGDFGIALDEGTYRLRVEPGPQWRTVAVATVDDSFTITDPSQTRTINVELAEPNLRGRVLLPGGGAAGGAWVEVRRWDSTYQQYVWDGSVPGANTSEDGAYALNLTDGRWELIANPPWGSTGSSRSSTKIIVSANGSSMCPDPTGTGTCSGSLNPSAVDLQLATPNVTGAVLTPDDDSVANTWVDLQRWNTDRGQYEWAADLQGVPVSFLGTFATTLPDGRYKLTANPTYGDSQFSRGSIEIEVTGAGVCLLGANPCEPPEGGFTITLATPNVSGGVFATEGSSDPVRFSSVGVERWEGGRWQWVDVWANTNASGRFSLNLTEPGAHRLTGHPSPQYADFTRGTAYVYVEGGGTLCALDDEVAAQSASGCAQDDTSLDIRIQLGTANLIGDVRDSNDNPLRDSWIEVFTQGPFGQEWIDGAGTNSQGRFALSLEPESTPQRYQLRVNPPWQNDQGLARANVTVWAYPANGATAVCPDSDWNGADCTAPVTLDTPLSVTLDAGNLRGLIVSPGQNPEGVGDTYANLERWVEAPWNPGSGTYVWQGADLYANANSQGAFSLNIEDTGVYRVNANPPWSGDGSLASGSSLIRVTQEQDGLRWCTVNDDSGSTQDPFGACTGPVSGDGSTLTVPLRTPNISVRVVDGQGDGVAGAWVSVRKEITQGSFTYWQWVKGDGTRRDGTFSTVINEAGSYSLEVYPPWDDDGSLARFTDDFTVTCTGGDCSATDLGTNGQLAFPTPNFQGAVASPTSAATLVSNAWVSVEQWDEASSNFLWTDKGTSTNRQGRFSMNLSEDDTYRLTANPSWENPEGVRTSVTVVVASGIATCVQGCLAGGGNVIQLRAPNVTGLVDDSGVPMTYSWIEVRDASGNWVTGTSTDAQGRYSLALEAGDYTLVAFPDWSVSTKPPRSVTVTVSGTGSQVVDIDLSDVDPNLTLCINVPNVTSSRVVVVDSVSGAVYTLLPEFTTRSQVGSGGCATTASWLLPDGNYRFTVMPEIGETFASGTNVSDLVVISNGMVTSDDTGIPAS